MATPRGRLRRRSGTGRGDIDRQLKYGRRLVGLRQQLPPEVYIDVGKSLLAREDVSGAERAFEMIDDITGLIDIEKTKAEMFEEAGYDEQSRVFYNRALNVNRNSLELLHKTGFLYEVTGREDVAFERYMQAIGDTLLRLRTVRPVVERVVKTGLVQRMLNQSPDSTVSREYRQYYASLEQGLLLNWPEGADESEAAKAELKALFDTELRNVLDRADEDLLPLTRYARLDRIASLIRRVGFYLRDDGLAQYADGKLLVHFGDDAELDRRLVRAYQAAGRALPDDIAVDVDKGAHMFLSALRRQLARAAERNDLETQLQLLWLAGATDEIEMLLGKQVQKGGFREGLGYGMKFLQGDAFKRLAASASAMLSENPEQLLEFLAADSELFLKVEETVGHPPVPAEDITALLTNPDDAGFAVHPGGSRGHWKFLNARGSLDDRIRYFRIYPRRELFYQLMRENLTGSQREEIANPIVESLSGLAPVLDDTAARSVRSWLPLDANPANADLLYRVAEYAERRWREFAGVRRLLEAAYEGRSEEAFRLLIDIGGNTGDLQYEMLGHFEHFFPGFRDVLSEPRARLLNEVAVGRYEAPELVNAAYLIEFLPAANRRTPSMLDREALILEKLHLLEPEHGLHFEQLISTLLLWSGHMNRSLRAIAREYRASPGAEHWRLAYFLLLVRQKRFEEALAVARDGGEDLRDGQVVDRLIAMHTVDGSAPAASILERLSPRRVAPRPSGRATPELRLRRALEAGDPEKGRQAFREALRKPMVVGPPSNHVVTASMHLRSNTSRILSTLDEAGSPPYVEGQLEAFLRAIPDRDRKDFYGHYEFLARTVDVAPRLQQLTAALQAQEIDDHEFLLWMVLRNRHAEGLASAELDAFQRRLAALPDPAPDQLLLAARILAAGGAVDPGSGTLSFGRCPNDSASGICRRAGLEFQGVGGEFNQGKCP